MATGKRRRRVGRSAPSITELFDQGTPIDEALRLDVRDALLRHKLLGQPVAVRKGRRIVVLEPDEIPVRIPRMKADRGLWSSPAAAKAPAGRRKATSRR